MALKEGSKDKIITEEILERYPEHREKVLKAYEFIKDKHGNQKRASGEAYIIHPIEVAKILADMNMDITSIVSAFLHDVLEDTDTSYDDLVRKFGRDVADIVEGVTKIGKLKFKRAEEAQAENFRKLLLAMSKDIRVMVVKLADRLHNMRTLKYLRKEKQIRIARETLEIYAPIAHRLGVWSIKTELEDLAFMYLYPKEYQRVRSFISESRDKLKEYLEKFVVPPVKEILRKNGIEATLQYRSKHLYSVWQKTIRKNIRLEDVHDILGVRVIVNSIAECYSVLGLIHSLFTQVPGKFKDYISVPKSNLYQSIHTTVVAPKGKMVEFQIRTYEMHERAEKGIAAHWAYKEGVRAQEGETFVWLRDLVESIQGSKDANELLDNIKRDLFYEEVFVFTPAGDIVVLPKGATPVDFAYRIHTDVGNSCKGAKVNGRIVPLDYKLRNGEMVEIITSPGGKPNPAWLNFVVTSRAKNKIKQYIKQLDRERYLTEGRKLLEKIRQKMGVSHEELIESLRKRVRFNEEEELLLALGSGKLSLLRLYKLLERKEQKTSRVQREGRGVISLEGLEGVEYRVAHCCMPVPGDEVYGVVVKGKGLVIHEKGCSNLKSIMLSSSERVFKVKWQAKGKFKTRIRLEVKDRLGILSDVTSEIAKRGSNVFQSKSASLSNGTASMEFVIDVEGKKHLQELMRSLKEIEGVDKCTRFYK